jgi:hypothetical protein
MDPVLWAVCADPPKICRRRRVQAIRYDDISRAEKSAYGVLEVTSPDHVVVHAGASMTTHRHAQRRMRFILAGRPWVDCRGYWTSDNPVRDPTRSSHPEAPLEASTRMLSWARSVDLCPKNCDRGRSAGVGRWGAVDNRDRPGISRIWIGSDNRSHSSAAVRQLHRPPLSSGRRRLGVRVERLSGQTQDPIGYSFAPSRYSQPVCLERDATAERSARSDRRGLPILRAVRDCP